MDNDQVDVREILNKFGDDIAGFRQRIEAMEGDIGFVKNRVSYHTSEIAPGQRVAQHHVERISVLESIALRKPRTGKNEADIDLLWWGLIAGFACGFLGAVVVLGTLGIIS